MTTNAMSLTTPDWSSWVRWIRRIVISTSIAIIAVLLSAILTIVAEIGLGGMVSEKTVDRNGVTSSSLIVGRTGTNTELSIVGFAPVISTQPATAIGIVGSTVATLNGQVTNMNGMPSATGYFQWGYGAGVLVNTTTTITITTVGNYSKNIAGFTTTGDVFYRFIVDADGTAYGAISQFTPVAPTITPPATTPDLGNIMMGNLLRIAALVAILVTIMKMVGRRKSLIEILTAIGIGIIAFIILSLTIDSAF